VKAIEAKFQLATERLALFTIMIAATVVANLIMVPMPQPLAQYDLSPVLIYTIGVLINPLAAGLIVASAQGIGTFYKTMIFGWPPVFILGAIFVRGVEAMLISGSVYLAKSPEYKSVRKLEIVAMIIGVVWETVGFFLLDWVLFGAGPAITTLGTMVDAIFIPVAVGLIIVIRRVFRVKRLM